MEKLTATGTKDLIYIQKQQIPTTVFIISRSVEIHEVFNLRKMRKTTAKFPSVTNLRQINFPTASLDGTIVKIMSPYPTTFVVVA